MSVNRHESEQAETHAVRLTAYALGQLEGQEQAEVERELAASPAARQTVESVRALADHLREAARRDISSGPSAALRAAILTRLDQLESVDAASRPPPRRFRHGLRALLALAACLLIAALPVAWLTWLNRQPGDGRLVAVQLAPPVPSGQPAPLPDGAAEAAPSRSATPATGSFAIGAEAAFEHDGGSAPAALRRDFLQMESPPADVPSVAEQTKPEKELVRTKGDRQEARRIAEDGKMAADSPAGPAPAGISGMGGVSGRAAKAGAPPALRGAVPPSPPAPAPAPAVAAGEKTPSSSPDRDVPEDQALPARQPTAGKPRSGPSLGGAGGDAAGVFAAPGPGAAGDSMAVKAASEPKEPAKEEAQPSPSDWKTPARPSDTMPDMGSDKPAVAGGYPGDPGVSAMMGAAGQAALPSRGTAAANLAPPWYAPQRLQGTSLDALQRRPLEVHSARRAGSQGQTVLSESVGASGMQPRRKADVPLLVEHPFVEVGPFPVSELPLNADRTSYEAVVAAVQAGHRPRAGNLDIQSLINAFPYRDPAPPVQGALTVSLEAAECPWKAGHRLVRIAVAAAGKPASGRPSEATSALAQSREKSLAASRPAGAPDAPAPTPVVASEVRILVEFNPLQAAAYRFIGVDTANGEQHARAEGAVSAAALKAGDRIVGLYQVIPPGLVNQAQFPQLRYQRAHSLAENLTKDAYSGQLLTVHVQYRDATTGKMHQAEFSLKDPGKPFREASADLRFAAAVAAFGMILRNSPYMGSATLEWVERTAAQAARDAPADERTQFVDLVRKLQRIPAH